MRQFCHQFEAFALARTVSRHVRVLGGTCSSGVKGHIYDRPDSKTLGRLQVAISQAAQSCITYMCVIRPVCATETSATMGSSENDSFVANDCCEPAVLDISKPGNTAQEMSRYTAYFGFFLVSSSSHPIFCAASETFLPNSMLWKCTGRGL